jgi:tetratricopeptide (TPR) repeat protein
MIGRAQEVARLRALWDDALGGRVRLALVGGEPGAGKTRLVAALAPHAEAAGGLVLTGRCRPDGPDPYQPFVAALDAAVGSLPTAWLRAHARRHGPALARLLPAVARRIGGVPGGRDGSSPTRLYAGLAAAMGELAKARPVLLVLEDLHWASRSTARLLHHLVDHSPRTPLLVVATYRDAEIDPSHPLAELLDLPRTDVPFERVVLEGLSPREVAGFVVDRVAAAGASGAQLAAALWQATEGNPLFLTESLRELCETGVVAGGEVKLAALAQTSLPADLGELVLRRLHRHDQPVREAVEVASVAGPEFTLAALRDAVAAKDDTLQAALGQAVEAGLLDAGEGRWRFAHDAFQAAVYASLPANRRVRLHDRVGESLERSPGADAGAARLAYHFVAAAPVGGSEKALRHAIRAAEQSTAVLAFDEAAEHYGQALAMLGGSAGATAVRCDLLLDLGSAYRRSGEASRSRQAFLQAAFTARANGDGPRLARASLGLGTLGGFWGADGELIGLLERALATTRDDPSLQAQLLARLAQARAGLDNPDQRKDRCDRAWELAWDSRDPATMAAVLVARHQALSAPDDLEDRVEAAGELLQMAAATGDDDLALRSHGWRFVDLLEQGRFLDADRDLAVHARLARQSGEPRHLRDMAAWSAARMLVGGNQRRAATLIDRALALGQEAGDADAPSVYWTQQWGLLLDWGEESELDGLVTVWVDLVRSHDQAPAWRARLALLLAATGRHADAAVHLEDLVADGCRAVPEDAAWLATLATLADTAALVGDATAAAPLARALAPYTRRTAVVEGGWLCRGSVARSAGLAAATAGRWSEAERHFERALAEHTRLDTAPFLARTQVEWGTLLAGRASGRDRDEGRRLMEAGAALAGSLGMAPLAEVASATLRPAGSR